MEWFIFALLTPILWAVVNVVDKFLLTKHIKNPISYQIIEILLYIPIIFLLLILAPIVFSFPFFLLGIAIGLIELVSILLYNRAIMLEEASRVISLTYLHVIFVLPLAYVFFGELLNVQKYFGVMLLVIGALLISYKKIKIRKWKFSSALKLILIIVVFWALINVLGKYTLGFMNYWSLMFWLTIGYMIATFFLLFFKKLRQSFLRDIKKLNKKILYIRILGSVFYYVGLTFFYIALSIGSVSLTTAVTSIQPFITFLYTTTLTLFAPKVIKEKIDKSTLTLKLIAIFLIFIGTWFVMT